MNNGASTAPLRISFAKIKEPLEVPNLLALQTESFDWLLGNCRVAELVSRRLWIQVRTSPRSPVWRRSSRRSLRSRTSPGRCR
jgi:DNA-directed RNA polymerase beta subunit